MADVLVERTSLEDIATAIRTKTDSEDTYTPSEMSKAINNMKLQVVNEPTNTLELKTADVIVNNTWNLK